MDIGRIAFGPARSPLPSDPRGAVGRNDSGFVGPDAPLRETIDGLKALARAANEACEALARLGEFEHGGITIRMVGSLMTCEVKPPAPHISGQPVD